MTPVAKMHAESKQTARRNPQPFATDIRASESTSHATRQAQAKSIASAATAIQPGGIEVRQPVATEPVLKTCGASALEGHSRVEVSGL